MSDLVERLRRFYMAPKIMREAADEIERLQRIEKSYIALHAISGEQQAEIERLRERLEVYPVNPSTGEFEKDEMLPTALDGIACRDETIAELEATNGKLIARIAKLLEAAKIVVRDFDLLQLPASCPELRKAIAEEENNNA